MKWWVRFDVRGVHDAGEREQFRFRLIDAVEKMTGLTADDYNMLGPFKLTTAIQLVQKLARSRYKDHISITMEN